MEETTTGDHPRVVPRVVIMLGPPGSGKGTQAIRLSREFSLPHVSTGDLFRENLSQGTALGKEAKGYMEKGVLVPDALVVRMLFDRVGRPDASKGYLLDGFPRTIPQAETLDRQLEGRARVLVLDLEVPDEVIVERIAGRLTCSAGHVFHLHFSPPKVAGICDLCGAPLIQRADDRPEVVKQRLAVYHEQTAPLIEYYEKKGVLVKVDGQKSQEEVFTVLASAIRQRLK